MVYLLSLVKPRPYWLSEQRLPPLPLSLWYIDSSISVQQRPNSVARGMFTWYSHTFEDSADMSTDLSHGDVLMVGDLH